MPLSRPSRPARLPSPPRIFTFTFTNASPTMRHVQPFDYELLSPLPPVPILGLPGTLGAGRAGSPSVVPPIVQAPSTTTPTSPMVTRSSAVPRAPPPSPASAPSPDSVRPSVAEPSFWSTPPQTYPWVRRS